MVAYALGQTLRSDEHVDHINGTVDDDRHLTCDPGYESDVSCPQRNLQASSPVDHEHFGTLTHVSIVPDSLVPVRRLPRLPESVFTT